MTTALSRNVGPPWYVILDDDLSRDLSEKITHAAKMYAKRHGRQPDICRVHPSACGKTRQVGDVKVVRSPYVLPHNLWLGRE